MDWKGEYCWYKQEERYKLSVISYSRNLKHTGQYLHSILSPVVTFPHFQSTEVSHMHLVTEDAPRAESNMLAGQKKSTCSQQIRQ